MNAVTENTVRARVQEGVSLSNPHRTALGIACSEGELSGAAQTTDLGLSAATDYATPNTIVSVSASGSTATTGVVTIIYRAIGSQITSGQNVVYTGTCGAGGMSWTVTGSVANKYLPRGGN